MVVSTPLVSVNSPSTFNAPCKAAPPLVIVRLVTSDIPEGRLIGEEPLTIILPIPAVLLEYKLLDAVPVIVAPFSVNVFVPVARPPVLVLLMVIVPVTVVFAERVRLFVLAPLLTVILVTDVGKPVPVV